MQLIDPYLISRIKANLRPLIFNVFLRTALAIWFCQMAIRDIVHSIDHEFFNELNNLFWATVSVIVFLFLFFVDRKQSKNKKAIIYYLPTSIFIIAAFLLSGIVHKLNQRDTSPVILKCVTKICDFNGMAIDFRKDGTYLHTSWCLGADYTRGRYSIKDSIITMHVIENEKTAITRLLIRPEIEIYEKDTIPGKDTTFVTSIYEIDSNGRIIPNAYDYRVL